MIPLLLMLGLGLVLVTATAVPKKKPEIAPGVTPAAESQWILIRADGAKFYRGDVVPYLIESLRTKSMGPPSPTKPEEIEIIEQGTTVEAQNSAYEGVRFLHSIARDIWVTPTLLNPKDKFRTLYAAVEDTLPPANLNLALLLPAAAPWPEAPIVTAPPVPPAAPPIPMAV